MRASAASPKVITFGRSRVASGSSRLLKKSAAFADES
jgi:hypothetical protein